MTWLPAVIGLAIMVVLGVMVLIVLFRARPPRPW